MENRTKTILSQLNNIFSKVAPKFIGKIGKYVRSYPISQLKFGQDLWSVWKVDKTDIKAAGYGVSQYGGEWLISLWSTVEDPFSGVVESPAPVEKPAPVEIKVNNDVVENSCLFDYQKPIAQAMINSLAKFGVVANNSGTGTGKTPVTCVTLKAINAPGLIICPKPVIYGWMNWAEKVGLTDIYFANYELIKLGRMIIRTTNKKGKKVLSKVECPGIKVIDNSEAHKLNKYEPKVVFKFTDQTRVVVFDEAHRCKNRNTGNTELMISAAEGKVPTIMLSATLAESPLKMSAIGLKLGLFEDREFWNWARDHQCEKGRFSWEYHGGRSGMEQIHREIGERMTGIQKEFLIAKGLFPEDQKIAEAYDLNGNTEKLAKVYEAMENEIAELTEKLGRLPPQAVLPIRQKYHQIAELLKVEAVTELAEDLIEQGQSVVVFCNFTQTLDKLSENLKAVKIYGGQTGPQNEAARVEFQNNITPAIVCNIAAAREGIDLHDEKHERPRTAILFPSDSAQNLLQCLGRVHRAGGTPSQQIIFFAAGTIEERICENVRAKLGNLSGLNDNDLDFFN